MDRTSHGGQLALDLYSLLRDLDPVRWREELEGAARSKLARVRARARELLSRDVPPASPAVSERVEQVAHVIEELDPSAPSGGTVDRRTAWMALRQRLVPVYEGLAKALRAESVPVPALRPTNWYRTTFHVLSAVGVVLLLEVLLSRTGTMWAAGGFAATCWVLETGRALSTRMNDVLMRFGFFKLIIHPHEHHHVNSATWYATALFLLSLFSPPYASAVGIAILGAGDPVAAAVGRRWGRTRLVHGRTLEGTLALLLSATGAAFLVLLAWHGALGPWPTLLGIALVASLVGALVELASVKLDDNFTIPLMGAGAAALAAPLLG